MKLLMTIIEAALLHKYLISSSENPLCLVLYKMDGLVTIITINNEII